MNPVQPFAFMMVGRIVKWELQGLALLSPPDKPRFSMGTSGVGSDIFSFPYTTCSRWVGEEAGWKFPLLSGRPPP